MVDQVAIQAGLGIPRPNVAWYKILENEYQDVALNNRPEDE